VSVILDSSALLAALNEEAGAILVRDLFPDVRISAVNLAEVVSVLARSNPAERVSDIVDQLSLDVVVADAKVAIDAGLLAPITASAGLSLGDRFCLALARSQGLPVVTADKAWVDVADGVGVEVRLIR
jgi:PIN domain nuclease of toxin-antitoxin system